MSEKFHDFSTILSPSDPNITPKLVYTRLGSGPGIGRPRPQTLRSLTVPRPQGPPSDAISDVIRRPMRITPWKVRAVAALRGWVGLPPKPPKPSVYQAEYDDQTSHEEPDEVAVNAGA